MKRIAVLLALVALVAVSLTGCGEARSYAARVDGDEISQGELEDELEAIAGNDRYLASLEQQGFQIRGTGRGETFDMAFVSRILTRQIFLELVEQEFRDRDLEISNDERRQAEQQVIESVGGRDVYDDFPESYRETLIERQAQVAALQLDVADIATDEEAVRRFYEAQGEQLFARTCVSHILFSVLGPDGRPDLAAVEEQQEQLLEQAQRTRARLERGAGFAELARELSADEQSGAEGGSLGCVGPGNFVPEFEMAMEQLAVGEISQPVKTQFGYHLILVTDRNVAPLEEVTEDVRQRLFAEAQDEFSSFLRQKVDDADIDVNPRYGTFERDTPSPGVVPPGAPTTTAPGEEAPTPVP